MIHVSFNIPSAFKLFGQNKHFQTAVSCSWTCIFHCFHWVQWLQAFHVLKSGIELVLQGWMNWMGQNQVCNELLRLYVLVWMRSAGLGKVWISPLDQLSMTRK